MAEPEKDAVQQEQEGGVGCPAAESHLQEQTQKQQQQEERQEAMTGPEKAAVQQEQAAENHRQEQTQESQGPIMAEPEKEAVVQQEQAAENHRQEQTQKQQQGQEEFHKAMAPQQEQEGDASDVPSEVVPNAVSDVETTLSHSEESKQEGGANRNPRGLSSSPQLGFFKREAMCIKYLKLQKLPADQIRPKLLVVAEVLSRCFQNSQIGVAMAEQMNTDNATATLPAFVFRTFFFGNQQRTWHNYSASESARDFLQFLTTDYYPNKDSGLPGIDILPPQQPASTRTTDPTSNSSLEGETTTTAATTTTTTTTTAGSMNFKTELLNASLLQLSLFFHMAVAGERESHLQHGFKNAKLWCHCQPNVNYKDFQSQELEGTMGYLEKAEPDIDHTANLNVQPPQVLFYTIGEQQQSQQLVEGGNSPTESTSTVLPKDKFSSLFDMPESDRAGAKCVDDGLTASATLDAKRDVWPLLEVLTGVSN